MQPERRRLHARLDVVPGEESGDAVHDALVPAVVVLLDHVDGGALAERQLVLLILDVVVDRHHCKRRATANSHFGKNTPNTKCVLQSRFGKTDVSTPYARRKRLSGQVLTGKFVPTRRVFTVKHSCFWEK